jgi:hypothetical protein
LPNCANLGSFNVGCLKMSFTLSLDAINDSKKIVLPFLYTTERWHSSVVQSHNFSSSFHHFQASWLFQVSEKLLKLHVSFGQQYLYTIFGPSEAIIIAKGSVRSRSAKIKLQNQTMHWKLQIAELIVLGLPSSSAKLS